LAVANFSIFSALHQNITNLESVLLGNTTEGEKIDLSICTVSYTTRNWQVDWKSQVTGQIGLIATDIRLD